MCTDAGDATGDCATAGGTTLTLYGASLGTALDALTVTVGDDPCPIVELLGEAILGLLPLPLLLHLLLPLLLGLRLLLCLVGPAQHSRAAASRVLKLAAPGGDRKGALFRHGDPSAGG